MQEPISTPDAGHVLQYQPERSYISAQAATSGAVISVLGWGVVAALIGAIVSALYLHLNLPFAVIVSPVAPALLVGFVLGRACRRFNVANQAVGILLSIFCCAVGVMLFHYGMFLFSVLQLRDHATQIVAGFASYGPTQRQMMVSLIQHHPFQAYDQLITLPRAHHGGYWGFILTEPPFIWVIAIVQVLVGAFVANRMTRHLTKLPFCQTCGRWFRGPVNISVLPLRCADELAGVIENGDVARAAELNILEHAPLGNCCAVARLYMCLGCQERFVEVETLIRGGRGMKLRPTRASAELVRALKDGQAEPMTPPPERPPPTTGEN